MKRLLCLVISGYTQESIVSKHILEMEGEGHYFLNISHHKINL